MIEPYIGLISRLINTFVCLIHFETKKKFEMIYDSLLIIFNKQVIAYYSERKLSIRSLFEVGVRMIQK